MYYREVFMISLRLPEELEIKLNEVSQVENVSKSTVIKNALSKYFDDFESKTSPFDLGKDLFGKYGSGSTDLSKTYKLKIKEKLGEKHSH